MTAMLLLVEHWWVRTGIRVSAMDPPGRLLAAAGLAVEAAVPGLGVFAVSFAGLVGAMVVLGVARLRRIRLPAPAPTVLVTGGWPQPSP